MTSRSDQRHGEPLFVEPDQDRRQLWARDMRRALDAPLFYLPEGMADTVRPDARSGHLVCPFPGCADPRYTTRGGSRRAHFAHLNLVGGGHAPESWFHYTAKRLIGAWLARAHPEASVTVDTETVESGQLPDVLATFPDGRRFAFEIQYAGLSVAAWERRHAGYVASGISDVWLFGHLPRYLAVDRPPDRYRLGVLLRHVLAAGSSVHWIDPDRLQVVSRCTATDVFWHDALMKTGEPPPLTHARCERNELDECAIEGGRFLTPVDRREEGIAARILNERAEELAARPRSTGARASGARRRQPKRSRAWPRGWRREPSTSTSCASATSTR